jgi:DNA polymerase-3 subunit gamma/tau
MQPRQLMKLFKGDLDETWSQIVAASDLPSTKMLLSQQAKLIKIQKEGKLFWKNYKVEIAISSKWINMIQSRKNIIEQSCQRVLGTKKVTVALIAND